MSDNIQKFLYDQQQNVIAMPMTREDVEQLIRDRVPGFILSMDKQPPKGGNEVDTRLGYFRGTATWFFDRRTTTTESAWQQTPTPTGLAISHGPLLWGDSLVDENWASNTIYGGTPEAVAFPAVTGNRWVYIQADLNASTVAGAFTSDANLPIHDVSGDNLIFRFPLSLWTITTSGTTTGKKIFTIPRLPEIPGWAPPRAT
jgi:hypothetical protein